MVKPLCYGRMGNFLYQAALAVAYSKKNGLEFTLPNTTTSEKWNPLYLQHLVNPNFDPSLPQVVIKENGHGFQEIPFKEEWRNCNIILDGYWQSERHWKEYRQDVLKAFNYPWELKKNVVSVHIRRGDYLELTMKHPPVPKEWVLEAMSKFPDKEFMFFSDDIAYCEKEYGDIKGCNFSQADNEETDLIGMSMCEAHICSSSTFSVWAYMLNQNPDKMAIFPKNWFVSGWDNCETKDIVPPECIKL